MHSPPGERFPLKRAGQNKASSSGRHQPAELAGGFLGLRAALLQQPLEIPLEEHAVEAGPGALGLPRLPLLLWLLLLLWVLLRLLLLLARGRRARERRDRGLLVLVPVGLLVVLPGHARRVPGRADVPGRGRDVGRVLAAVSLRHSGGRSKALPVLSGILICAARHSGFLAVGIRA